MAEFVVNDIQYRSGKLNAFQQFHCARKLGPVIAKLGPSFSVAPTSLDDMAEKLAPVVDALAAMSEDDCNYVLIRCLSVVQRQQGQLWSNVWNEQARRFMFDDIDLPAMIQIAMQVLSDNLSNFFSGQPGTSASPASQGSSSPTAASSVFPIQKTG